MPENCSQYRGGCEVVWKGLLLVALIRTSEALAGEQNPLPGSSAGQSGLSGALPQSQLSAQLLTIPEPFRATALPEPETFSPQEFRPHAPSALQKEVPVNSMEDAPMTRDTVWQRLAEFRTHDRVRVLTLWETGGSSVSLQAGRKGSPSLQWTSRFMNHGGATHGVLDKLIAASLAGASTGLHPTSRAKNGEPGTKPAQLSESGGGGTK